MSDEREANPSWRLMGVLLRHGSVYVEDGAEPSCYELETCDFQLYENTEVIEELTPEEGGPNPERYAYFAEHYCGTRLFPKQADPYQEGFVPDIEISARFRAVYSSQGPISEHEFDELHKLKAGEHVAPHWLAFLIYACQSIGLNVPPEALCLHTMKLGASGKHGGGVPGTHRWH